jgi:allantoinase
MTTYDTLLRSGMLVTSAGTPVADVAIAGGRIAAVGPELPGTAREEIACDGLYVFPGVIDAHVHFNEPGRTAWEGWATGTRALAAGGATCCCEMPLNAHPPTLDAASFDLKRAAAEASALVDFALWGGLVPGNVPQLEELAERGVIGFKAFMSASGIEDFAAADDLTLYAGMREAARLGRLVAVHAENDTLTRELAARAIAEGHTGVSDYLASRPVVAELEAIARAITFAEDTGCPLHIVHVSTGRGVALVAEARARGVDVSCETCPHYLIFTEEEVERIGPLSKCAPPIRSQTEQDALWRLLADGTLPMVASDHSPAPADMKADPSFFRVWGGISGCQSLLPLLLTEGYHRRALSLPVITAATSEFVARRFGIAHKGRIEAGHDADLALVAMDTTSVLQSSDLHYRHPHSPYVGRTLKGSVIRTLVRGTTVYLEGEFVSNPIGRLVTPAAS